MSKAAQQSGVPGARRVAGLVRRAERWISAEASAVGVIAKGFSSYVESLGVDPAKLYHVPNWTHIEPATQSAAATQQRFGLPQDKIICLHAGNMGFKQGLENVIECARLAQQTNEQKLLFVMLGDGSRRAELLELTARYGLSNVRFLPIQPADSFANLLGAADVLLLNQMANVVDMSLPGKLTCYFFAERPVVAAVNSRSETAREIVDSGGGIVVNPEEPALLLEAICELASDPNRRLQLGRTGAAYARNNLTAGMSLRRCSEFLNLIARPALAGNVATEGVSYLANPN